MNNFISIVIATFNRGNVLNNNLATFVKQNYPPKDFELIVVDDGSTDETKSNIEALKAEFPKNNIIYLCQDNRGPAVARNSGVDKAKGKIIALSDDDCRADNDWLSQINNSYLENPSIIGVGGVTLSNKDKITPFTSQIENSHPQSFLTCNVSYKKDIFQKIGGFAKVFPFPSNEDSDLAWRMEKEGEIIHNPKMKIVHPPRPVSFWKIIKNTKYLETEFILFARQKERYLQERKNPWYHIIYICGIKHFIRDIVRNVNWLWRNPFIYIKFILFLLLQRLYLMTLIIKWLVNPTIVEEM